MSMLRSPRVAALALGVAAAAGLALANSPVGAPIRAVRDAHASTGLALLDLSPAHWITDGLLALFFFVVAIELRHELTRGELHSARAALAPVIAASGGVLVPALIYLLLVRDPGEQLGWPIPTATDIAFALGVLALLGRGLPRRVRAFLLALAVLDDLIAIVIIAIFFTRGFAPLPAILAIVVIAGFGWLSTLRRVPRPVRIGALVVLGIAAWALVFSSGIHATIAGVGLGLVMAPEAARRVRHALEPWVNGLVLPLFALSASMVVIPAVRADGIGPVFWAILIALPLGKLVGISAGALLARSLTPARDRGASVLLPREIAVVATLGGVGFTISLLMAELAFRGDASRAAAATLAVLCGSAIAIVIGGVTTALVARSSRLSSSER